MEIPDIGYSPTLPEFVRRAADRYGDRELMVTPEGRITYAEVEEASRRVGKDLIARGHGKGARIGFMYGNTIDWMVLWLAIGRIGAIAMPFPTTYRPAELRKGLRIADVETLIVPAELFGIDQMVFLEQAIEGLADATGPLLRLPSMPFLRSVLTSTPTDRPWAGTIRLGHRAGGDHPDIDDEFFRMIEAEVHPVDPVLVVFTSGTTAEPKAVLHSHGTYVRHAHNVAESNDVPSEQRLFNGMPFFWIGGVSHTIGPLMVRGNTLLGTAKADAPAGLELLQTERVDGLYMYPNQAHRLREYARSLGVDPQSVPALAVPSSDVPADRRASGLGMTETCASYISSGPRDHVIPEEYRGAHGFTVPMSQYRIVDLETGEELPEGTEGEICVRGYSLMLGMCKRERHELWDDDGWYHTGDKGYLRGPYIWFTGRAKDLIKTAGANVAPCEVEMLLDSYADVLMSVVFGLDDAERGEIVGAVIVPAAGSELDPVDLVTRANRDLSSYKVPRRVLLLTEAEMPYLATGKPDRQALAARLAADGERVAPVRR